MEVDMHQASDIAKYFIYCTNLEEDGVITNLKLQKLLYYAQGFHLALFDLPLFSEDIIAWQYGPVVPEIYRKYKNYTRNPLPEPIDFNPEIINSETRELIDEVYQVFGKYTGTALVNLTHQELPWKETAINDVISHDIMKGYFQEQLVKA
jgi:uncharacterized phage-associated protein